MSSQYITYVGSIDPELRDAMLFELAAAPDLWNRHTGRTQHATSPHREVDDIWFRYAEDQQGVGPHESVWYPAADAVPAVREIARDLMWSTHGDRLGGVLMTRIPAGATCYPHADAGWHADYYKKFAVQIESAPGQAFHFEDGYLEPRPGAIYTFDNHFTHGVTNPTEHDRITLIVCIKTDKEYLCPGQR